MVGLGTKSSTIYVIDFGLAKPYKNPANGEHIPYKIGKNLTGTARYASINTHLGCEQSRRDDLEGILYVVLYLLKGSLPWQGQVAKNKQEKYKKIQEAKEATSIDTLCTGLPGIPFITLLTIIDQLKVLLKYARALKFEETPKYDQMHKLLKEIADHNSFQLGAAFDWANAKTSLQGKPTKKEDYKQDQQSPEREEAKDRPVAPGMTESQIVNMAQSVMIQQKSPGEKPPE